MILLSIWSMSVYYNIISSNIRYLLIYVCQWVYYAGVVNICYIISLFFSCSVLTTLINPRNPGYILQCQTLDNVFRAVLGQFFLYHPWNMYKWGAHAKNWVSRFHILVGGPPQTFIFRACLIWPSDSWQIWQNFGFVEFFSKSLSKLNQNY